MHCIVLYIIKKKFKSTRSILYALFFFVCYVALYILNIPRSFSTRVYVKCSAAAAAALIYNNFVLINVFFAIYFSFIYKNDDSQKLNLYLFFHYILYLYKCLHLLHSSRESIQKRGCVLKCVWFYFIIFFFYKNSAFRFKIVASILFL
jgi:hypothetical protein